MANSVSVGPQLAVTDLSNELLGLGTDVRTTSPAGAGFGTHIAQAQTSHDPLKRSVSFAVTVTDCVVRSGMICSIATSPPPPKRLAPMPTSELLVGHVATAVLLWSELNADGVACENMPVRLAKRRRGRTADGSGDRTGHHRQCRRGRE
jgi:hypothetical protein